MDKQRASSLALVAAGGLLGATLRHLLAVALPSSFPVGTLVANLVGAFLLGVVLTDERLADRFSPEMRLFVGAGFCSSLSTYSTFAAETTQLPPRLAVLNVGLTYVLGFLAVLLGRFVVRWSA